MNIFVSRPTVIGEEFESGYCAFQAELISQKFVLQRLGDGINYSKKAPLRKVVELIRECCGALVLGYPQFEFRHIAVRSTKFQNEFRHISPTPWNQIEGALAYAYESPILVVAHTDKVAETGITGGIFDDGITGEKVLRINLAEADWFHTAQFSEPFQEWVTEVRECSHRRSKSSGSGSS